ILVPFQNVSWFYRNLRIVEVAVSVVIVVAIEFESAAVEGVCTGFGDNRNDPAGVATILSFIIAGDDFELLDRVGVRIIDNAIAEKVVVVAAIKNESVGIVASTRNAESGVGAGGASVAGVI